MTVTAVTSAPPRDDGAMSSSQSKPLRVLALHGWRTSGRVLDWQYSSYASLAPKLSDLVEVRPGQPTAPENGGWLAHTHAPFSPRLLAGSWSAWLCWRYQDFHTLSQT